MDYVAMNLREWSALRDSLTYKVATVETNVFNLSQHDLDIDLNVSKYWHTRANATVDVFVRYSDIRPSRIPIIPWRVFSSGMRIVPNNATFQDSDFPGVMHVNKAHYKSVPLHPQLFPSSYLFSDEPAEAGFRTPAVYSNYSKFVELVPYDEEVHGKPDFAWRQKRADNGEQLNEYMMVYRVDFGKDSESLLMVKDPSFFLGLGSVVTAQHAAFGIGRHPHELHAQYLRARSGEDGGTSGHMFAAVLAHTAHCMWYLHEVMLNMKTKRSIYSVSFDEPKEAVYHTVQEYRNALIDMKTFEDRTIDGITTFGYPKFYVTHHINMCARCVDKMDVETKI